MNSQLIQLVPVVIVLINTPLHIACGMGHLEVVKFLIEEKGCDYTLICRNKEGFAISPLHSACENGHLDIVRYLVDEQSVDLTYAKSDNITSWTPLHAACSKGHLEIVKFLIEEKGCNHTQVYQEEESLPMSPLHVASGYGHLDIVRYLVDEQSVDLAGANSDNVTPLHAACAMGHLEIVKFLIEEKDAILLKRTLLRKALRYLLFIQLVRLVM